MKTVKLGVVIGRFQPIHQGHKQQILEPCYKASDHMLILLGSANRAISPKNPFSPEERFGLITAALQGNGAVLHYEPLNDFTYSDHLWVEQVQRKVSRYIRSIETLESAEVKITLWGAHTDASSYYLKLFPQWNIRSNDPLQVNDLNATYVRSLIYAQNSKWKTHVPVATWPMLENWMKTDSFKWCQDELEFYKNYKKPYDKFEQAVGHGYIALTCDPAVFHKGRVLLVRRKFHPGKGLWALPGGYLEVEEEPLDGAIRECKEETKFKLSKSWMFKEAVYGKPQRSLKGRVITFGFGFHVPDRVDDDPISHAMAVSYIKAGSDAAHTQWIPVADVMNNEQYRRGMFEDHFDIIADMYRNLPTVR